jgi:hypothetical protein
MQAEKPEAAAAFQRQPPTVFGRNLISSLKRELRFKNIYDPQCVKTFSGVEKAIMAAVDDFFNHVYDSSIVPNACLGPIFVIIENILNYPYYDKYRIVNVSIAMTSLEEKIMKLASTPKLLKAIGFETSSNHHIFVLSHDKPLAPVLFA